MFYMISSDGLNWTSEYETREEAKAQAQDFLRLRLGDKFYVAEVDSPATIPYPHAATILEAMRKQGLKADGTIEESLWLKDVSRADTDNLQNRLDDTIDEWCHDTGNYPDWKDVFEVEECVHLGKMVGNA